MKQVLSFATAVFALPFTLIAQKNLTLSSPNGKLMMSFSLDTSVAGASDGSGRLQYSLKYQGKPLLEASALGLELDDKASLGSNVMFTDTKPNQGVDDYALLFTKISHVHEAYNSLSLTVKDASSGGRRLSSASVRMTPPGCLRCRITAPVTRANIFATICLRW